LTTHPWVIFSFSPQKTVERKQQKYAPLIEELIKEG
jgi:hypothetical protein